MNRHIRLIIRIAIKAAVLFAVYLATVYILEWAVGKEHEPFCRNLLDSAVFTVLFLIFDWLVSLFRKRKKQ